MKLFIIRILAILFILHSGFLFADSVEDSKKLFEQASALVNEGNKPDAIPFLRQSIQLDENNFWSKKLLVDILTEAGEELYNKGYEKSAYNYYREAVKYWSNHPKASYWYNKLKPQADQLQDNPLKQQLSQTSSEPQTQQQSSQQTSAVTQHQPAVVQVLTQKTIMVTQYRADAVPAGSTGTKNIFLTEKQLQKLVDLQEWSADEIKKQRDRQLKIIAIAGTSVAVFVIVVVLLVVARVTGKPVGYSLRKNRKTLELSTPGMIDKVKELIRAYKVDEFARIIENGEMDWSVIRQYLAEMDRNIRLEVLSMIESKINREIQPLTSNQAELLMTLLVDGDDFIRRKANLIMAKSMVDTSRPVQISMGDNTALALPESQEVHRRQEHNRRQTDYFIDVNDLKGLIPLSKIVDKRMFGGNHSANVAKGTYQVAVAMGNTPQDSNIFYIAGLAHNIGYLDLNSDLIQKPDKLTKSEEETMRRHPERGLELLDFTRLPEAVADGILYHHERWDGGGYCKGKSGEDIPVVARIIAVIDAYYAMISERPYREKKSKEDAVETIKKLKNKWFDPKVVDVFLFLCNQNLL